jgi:hypothetical protein
MITKRNNVKREGDCRKSKVRHFNCSPLNTLSYPMVDSPHLTWLNVGFGFLFILFDAILSATLGLGIGGSLVVAATRCVIQLSIMGLVLDKVFASDNIWGVIGIARESVHQYIGLRLTCSPAEPTGSIRDHIQQDQEKVLEYGTSTGYVDADISSH